VNQALNFCARWREPENRVNQKVGLPQSSAEFFIDGSENRVNASGSLYAGSGYTKAKSETMTRWRQ
jgi:hypothetical protein